MAGRATGDRARERRTLQVAVVAAIVLLVAVVWLSRSDSPYEVTARFASASGVSKGGLVKVAGRRVGTVERISLSDDGQAELRLRITDDAVTPLRRGTIAALRTPGLSSIAGKYVDLRIPSGTGAEIPEGGVLGRTQTTSSVDLDAFFNLFDERTRAGLRKVVRGSGEMTKDRELLANEGWKYLSPSLAASQRLFRELGDDRAVLERFVVDSARLVTNVAARRTDVTKLVDGLADTTQAIASRDDELSDAIGQLPDFLRTADTTFANLRGTVGDLDGLLADTKPVAPKLRATAAQLRPFAAESVPTLRSLASLARRPGAGNDLVELYRAFPALRDIATKKAERNGQERDGSLPAAAAALREAREPLGFLRAYGVELTGWFDDFGHSGIYDGFGNASRVETVIAPTKTLLDLLPLPASLTQGLLKQTLSVQRDRCPGAMERPAPDGSNPWKPTPEFACDPSEKPIG
ncbi:hypothetical protein DSM112329_02489 [Paraconexibacter sp. AEG42_29]|uniref:Mce/MlaD domain-containing protein n=1 Tax=Paraconexibacter sp. AEG42_29 TaxID=2997339 RepID=A0AAU7AVI7_9ACTN